MQKFSLSLPIKTVQSCSHLKKIFDKSNNAENLLSSDITNIKTETCIIRRTTINSFRSPINKNIFPHNLKNISKSVAHTPSPIRKAHLNFQAAVHKQQKKIMSQLHTQRKHRALKKTIKQPSVVYKKEINFRNVSQALNYQKLIPVGFGYRMPTFMYSVSPPVPTITSSSKLKSSYKCNSPLNNSNFSDNTSKVYNIEPENCFSFNINHEKINKSSVECVSENLFNENVLHKYDMTNSNKYAQSFPGRDSYLQKILTVESCKDELNSINKSSNIISGEIKKTGLISCYICGMKFCDIKMHNAHIKDHNKDIDDLWL